MFFAGHKNAKFAFIATLWELSQNPQIQDKLYQEIAAHSPSLSKDNLKDLPYLIAVLSETLRLYPPVNQNTWGPTAHEYQPERWGDNFHAIQRAISQQPVRGSYIPFNAWTRSCIGSEFALLQLRVTLYEVVHYFEITSAPDYHYLIKEASSNLQTCCDIY
ncbi:hypothetical protein EYZ11_011858 [Aspergillus tanneri]|uniref:Cytochrome P450 n=1 Tax=Aspergillus tanneri TaxID=1220188 RepID=A0A4S3J1P6_9EURO|nr:hypothetical protein EYZ11_011858 [Aspergillus tanneri]